MLPTKLPDTENHDKFQIQWSQLLVKITTNDETAALSKNCSR